MSQIIAPQTDKPNMPPYEEVYRNFDWKEVEKNFFWYETG